ncbi:MAG: ABC transporter ATP-binding protein [Rhodospirillales bacterium]|nr:ABC transporter ATP-binding protein [Rhodospirillales bacterium]
MSPLLDARDLQVYYGPSHVLQGVSLAVAPGTVTALLGRNGAGKTTTLRALMGLTPPRAGTITFDGAAIAGTRTSSLARLGLTLVPEHRGMFPSLSVAESLAIARPSRAGEWSLDRVLDLFPRLAERLQSRSGHLSGGEQQMLAIGRALLTQPRLLMLDEPTQGLAPLIVAELLGHLQRLKGAGLTILLVEQNLGFASTLADRAVLLGKGQVRWAGAIAELAGQAELAHTWLGV